MQIVLLVATGLAAIANWWSRWRDSKSIELWSKPLTTVLVIGLALASEAPTGHIVVAVVALVLCLAGDVALMPVVDKFVIGLAAFLLGHIAFMVLFVRYGLESSVLAGTMLILAGALVATVGVQIVRGATVADPALRTPVLAYLAVISVMCVCGWATGMGWVIAGSTLFLLSDSVLGWRQFVRDRPWMPVAVMVTYHGAIASLALSLW
ncbi:MAG: lysoplasmalogenase [Actinomycetota bacterium]|nr:lysoplasmalogenase [Actinomycetota bacterium]